MESACTYIGLRSPTSKPNGYDLRTLATLRALNRATPNLNVHFVESLAGSLARTAAPVPAALPSIFKAAALPFMRPHYNDLVAHALIETLRREQPKSLIIDSMELAPFAVAIRRSLPSTRLIFDMRDRLSRSALQEIRFASLPKRAGLIIRFLALKFWELQILRHTDHVVLLSRDDGMADWGPPRFRYINNGTPLSHKATPPPNGVEKFLLFVADFKYRPNALAAEHIINNTSGHIPDEFKIVMAGPGLPDPLQQSLPENVVYLGFVDDLSPLIAKSFGIYAPIHIGTGIKNKILEAMAASKIVFTTPLGNDGIHAEHMSEIAIFETDAEFIACLVNISHDENLRQSIEQRAKMKIDADFSDNKISDQWREIIHA